MREGGAAVAMYPHVAAHISTHTRARARAHTHIHIHIYRVNPIA